VNRRALVIVSVIALVTLGSIALALALANSDSANGSSAEPTPETGREFDGVTFSDPQGDYRIDIDPDWTELGATEGDETESWQVDDGRPDDRVEITTEDVGDLDLDQYLQLEIERAPTTVDEFKLREFRVLGNNVDPPDPLGVVAYEGRIGEQSIGIYLVVSVREGRAVVARFTTSRDDFRAARAAVEPYFMTLRQT
jgi:hypothetical protein